MKKILFCILILFTLLTGCRKADRVNYNIRKDADNFAVRRRVVALNTRTNEALFTVEGNMSIAVDGDGDLNLTIQTGPDQYKLFFAHLSDSVTYTAIQIDASEVSPYAYEISFFPAKDALENGLIDISVTEKDNVESEVTQEGLE